MPNRVNRLLLSETASRYRNATYLIAIGYEGLSVMGTNALRGKLAAGNMRVKLVKNRIAKLAFDEIGIKGVEKILKGQTAFVVGTDPVAMARSIRDFAVENKQVVFRGAIIEGSVLGAADAKGLAEAASKEELQARIVGAAVGQGAKLVAAINGPAGKLAGCIKSLVEKLEKQSA